jgi:hypothetical protein
MDMTTQAEALHGFVFKTIEEELTAELSFLAKPDKTDRREIAEPDDIGYVPATATFVLQC